MAKEKFIVRFYDGFDNRWIDVSDPISKEEAERIWNRKTDNGKKMISFSEIDYYRIFPADIKMYFSYENLG